MAKNRTLLRRWFPHPIVSLLVFVAWILVAGSYNVQSAVMASLLAIIIPRMVSTFIQRTEKINVGLAIKLFLIVLWDIIISNIKVAKMVLGPLNNLQPKWYRVPLETQHDEVNALLAMIITTTPGTVSAGIDQERGDILVHALSSTDEQADIQDIKDRYEALLIKIYNVNTGEEQ